MEWAEVAKKIILTNIPNYYVTDENCENLYYKALANGIESVVISPSSMKAAEMFRGRGIKTGVTVAYPSGASFPDLKVQEIADCENDSGIADMYIVTAAVGYFMSGHEDNLKEEMESCVQGVKKPVYFITEVSEMPEDYLKKMCQAAQKVGVKGIVISAAFAPYDITPSFVNEIKRVKKYTGEGLEIIAFGFFESKEEIEKALSEGADRVIVNDVCKLIKA